MRKPKRFDERLQDQRDALERTRARIAGIQTQQRAAHQNLASHSPIDSTERQVLDSPRETSIPQGEGERIDPSPRVTPRFVIGAAGLSFYDRLENRVSKKPEPWTKRLGNLALQVFTDGGTVLALLWPAPLHSVTPLHALASFELNLAADLRGLRTLLYPATYTAGTPLNSILVDRRPFGSLHLGLCSQDNPIKCTPDSVSMRAVLAALNFIEAYTPTLPHPALAELIPTFSFDHERRQWTTHQSSPLERTLKKVTNQSYRKDLREKVSTEWAQLETAPDALMLLHNTTSRSNWKDALTADTAKRQSGPNLFLLDATGAASQSNFKAVRRIPEFLKVVREIGHTTAGALVLTDDPKTYFTLRKQFRSLDLKIIEHVEASEYEGSLLAAEPHADGWQPAQRSNAYFEVGIVDQEASAVAVSFFRLSKDVEEPESGLQSLHNGALFFLRLSNFPAGYRELAAAAEDGELDGLTLAQHDWLTVEQAILADLKLGRAAERRPEIERLIQKSRDLIGSWTDGTPMALRLRRDIESRIAERKSGVIALVLPNRRYIRLAERYLSRTLSGQWASIAPRIEWHTLTTVTDGLKGTRQLQHVVFVGLNRNVLRILLAHPEIPHGTLFLIALRDAAALFTTLRSMKTLDPLKSFRGRIGLLTQEVERRLNEIGTQIDVSRLGEKSLLFSWNEPGAAAGGPEHDFFTFELDDGGRSYSSGQAFILDSNEDPPFRRVLVGKVKVGDFIFKMSDSLRSKVEDTLRLNEGGVSSLVDPLQMLLKLYHNDVLSRAENLFSAPSRRAIARNIHEKMVTLDASMSNCSVDRVYYWLNIEAGDRAPHASSDPRCFKVFCKTLGINESTALDYWRYVKGARKLNQIAGRILSARYSEILFHPESSIAYRKIPELTVKALQQEALGCVFRVNRIIPPVKQKEGKS